MLGVRLGEETEQRLAHLAKATGRSKSYYAKQAIDQFLEEREDLLLALAALEKVKAGEATVSLEEIREKIEQMDD